MQPVRAIPPHGGDAQMGSPFEVTVVRADATHAWLRAAGQLDMSTVENLTAVLETLLGWGRRHVRLDLTATTVSDRRCLDPLVRVHEMFLAEHGLLVLTSVSPDLADLLREDRLSRALFVTDQPRLRRPVERSGDRTTAAAGSRG
jgi:anti-anti-sigma regulatory factor